MQKFYYDNRDILEVILLPRYSPYMNPQKQIWHYIKAKLYKPSECECKYELTYDINFILDDLNLNKDKIRSLADGGKYLL